MTDVWLRIPLSRIRPSDINEHCGIEDDLHAVSGKPVLVHKDPTAFGYASIKIASEHSPAHLLRCKLKWKRSLRICRRFSSEGTPSDDPHGMQIVMFTHQDSGGWADLGMILGAADEARKVHRPSRVARPTG